MYFTIQPRILPRGPIDAAVGLVVGVIQLCAVMGLAIVPAFVVNVLTQNPLAVVLTWLTSFILMSIFACLPVVEHLRCDQEGLEFVTALGARKKISWANVESIEEASQAELVLRGWLWPRFPPREYTASMTSIGHYRICWQGGTAYFPPKDVQQFLYAVHVGRSMAAAS